jgi:hypothetical protein
MQLDSFATPAAFLAAAEPHLLEAEVENNLILGITRGLLSAPASGPGRSPYLALVRDPEVQVCAFSTLPGKAGITRCTSSAALTLLAQDMVAACPQVRDLVGPEPTIGRFADIFAPLRGARVVRRIAQRIHQVRTVEPLARVPLGHFRIAAAQDVELLALWIREFMTEVEDHQGDAQELATSRLAAGQLFIWEDGEPVSMAGWTGRTDRGVRIGFVYTPPRLRGRGYASACVTALTQRMLASGLQYCCLYTDVANPTSNAIYARIGYRPVCEAGMYTLAV